MPDIQSAIDSFVFRLGTLDWLDALDLLLVTIAIYALLRLLRRSQAAFVLRAALMLAGLLLLANLLLPLPTFGILLSLATVAIVITLLIVLQPEIRRWLEQFGRRVGFAVGGKESMAGQVIPEITRAVENLASSKTGALIVLEGVMSLTEIIDTGVRVDGKVTAELLQTIFFDRSPLHDGAVVISDDDVVAAGCVLPLSDHELHGWRRLGTRHRAAVGISEVSDSLTIVVSEETGAVSVAEDGKLHFDLERTQLRQALQDFYASGSAAPAAESWKLWKNWHFPSLRDMLGALPYLVLAILLALAATTAVRLANNPVVQGRQEDVPLVVEGLPEDTTLTTSPPETVIVSYEAPESELPSIGVSTFQATVSLSDVSTGVTRVPVKVTTTSSRVNVLAAIPAEVDLTVAAIISKTIPIHVRIDDADTLSAAYEISGEATTSPESAIVSGPEPSVNAVVAVGTSISVANATSTVREERPLAAQDQNGNRMSAVVVDPTDATVTVVIRRRINARDVGVRAITTGSPPEGYWLSGLSVEPATVTIQGSPSTLVEMDSFVETLPVDLSQAVGTLVVDVPLDLPQEVNAVDSNGNPITNVTVTAFVDAQSGDLVIQRPVELINDRSEFSVTIEPPQIQLLLSGPLPTLNAIELQPDLVQVVIDAAELMPGRSIEMLPQVIAPDDVRYQLVDTSVLVTTGE